MSLEIIKESKPWGQMECVLLNNTGTVQILKIREWESLSLHYHEIRNDHWYILSGSWTATIGNENINVSEWDLIYLEKLTPHSVTSHTGTLIVLEICLDFFDFQDTHRIRDKYGRE